MKNIKPVIGFLAIMAIALSSYAKNPFEAKHLEDTAAALKKALKTKPTMAGNNFSIIVNGLSPFWTATAIGSQVAASKLQAAVSFQAPVKFADSQLQLDMVKSAIKSGYKGLAISPIDATALKSALNDAKSKNIPVISVDSDLSAENRYLYLGTNNYKAGFEAGKALVQVLGKKGGKVIGLVGVLTASNAIDRIRGINDAIKNTKVKLETVLVDQIDQAKAYANAKTALETHPDLSAFITIYAYDGPAAAKALIEAKKTSHVKIVAFDLQSETIEHLKTKVISVAVGQRPYFWGYLSTYILQGFNVLGIDETMKVLQPYLEGDKKDILDTGVDIVTPATLSKYNAYLNSLGIKSQ